MCNQHTFIISRYGGAEAVGVKTRLVYLMPFWGCEGIHEQEKRNVYGKVFHFSIFQNFYVFLLRLYSYKDEAASSLFSD